MSHSKILLICDLDGTLVDSYPGIAESLKLACAAVGIEPAVPITPTLVGPPLDAMLAVVSGPRGVAFQQVFRKAFVDAYDGGVCALAQPFAGIDAMLKSLSDQGADLALATNKRLTPTRLIVRTCGWGDLFHAIEATDSRPGPVRTKAQMLSCLREATGTDPTSVYYLGDTEADLQAALRAGVGFLLAGWGYDPRVSAPGVVAAPTPSSVCSLISAVADFPRAVVTTTAAEASCLPLSHADEES